MRQRCYQCLRPTSLCVCDAIPQIDNRTHVLMLQHVGERFHPFNTARMVAQSLRRCQLSIDHNQRFGTRNLPIQANAGLLFPGANATALHELPATERPAQLVIIDGTWRQAETIVRDVPQLQSLPRYRLTPSLPGQYRIRREPDAQSLSTVEATVAALRALEPETVGLDQLLSAFEKMVAAHLGHTATRDAWRQKKSRETRPRFLPRALLHDTHRLVVAYGESTPGRQVAAHVPPSPVNWFAHRLGTGDRVGCHVRQREPIAEAVRQHMGLSSADCDAAVSEAEFRDQWSRFIRPSDALIVYHQKTCRLLENAAAMPAHCYILKSIFGKWRRGFRSIEELIALEGVHYPVDAGKCRAEQRLDMALALVRHLRSHYGNMSHDAA